MGILWDLFEKKKEAKDMMKMNISGGSKFEIDDSGKVSVSKDIADEINNNTEDDDNGKKPDFKIKE